MSVSGLTLKRTLPYIMIGGGLIGFLASFVLTYDKIQVLIDPNYEPPCNINPIFSCGSVMATEQASLLGVPNSVFGIAAFTALITLGFVLANGAKLKSWMWQLIQAAATLGVIFMHYLFFQGVFRISAICPWCFVIWMITIPIFWYITLYNAREGNININKNFSVFLQKNHGSILIIWYLIIFLILLIRFWYYWETLI